LAHRGDDDAVLEGNAPELQGSEEFREGDVLLRPSWPYLSRTLLVGNNERELEGRHLVPTTKTLELVDPQILPFQLL